jgi:hypothetical protein
MFLLLIFGESALRVGTEMAGQSGVNEINPGNNWINRGGGCDPSSPGVIAFHATILLRKLHCVQCKPSLRLKAGTETKTVRGQGEMQGVLHAERANARPGLGTMGGARRDPVRPGHVGVLALMLAVAPAEESRAQEADAAYDLPPIEVVVSPPLPPRKKYPNVTVTAKRPATATRPTPAPPVPAADATVTPAGTESFDGLQIAIPGIAVVGDIIPLGPHGTWELDGSGQVVTGEELYTSHVFNTAEALRKVTGVNVRVSAFAA